MICRANTTVTIYRGQAADEWGDNMDQDTVVATGVIASIVEQTVYARSEVTTNPRAFHYAKMRVNYGTNILVGDRVLDENTGDIWLITNLRARGNPVRRQDVRVDLELMG